MTETSETQTYVTKALKEDIKAMVELNDHIYSSEWHVPEEYLAELMEKNPEVYNILNTEEGIKGIVSFFPLTKDIYEAVLCGKLEEKDISDYLLDYSSPKEVYLYLISLIVDIREYNYKNYSRQIIQSIPAELKRIEAKGITIKEIGAIAISTDGENVLPKIGFTQDEKSYKYPIFRASVAEVLNAIRI